MSGTLYLIPCPISSSAPEETIPQRTLEVARSLDYFLVEAARTARGTLKSMGHPQPISTLTIEEIGHDPEAGKIDAWLAPVVEGRSAGIISESGCPGIADPGARTRDPRRAAHGAELASPHPHGFGTRRPAVPLPRVPPDS